ncbi:MAG: hypothetical protein AAGF81_08890 [Pseudomonadota bacterium]
MTLRPVTAGAAADVGVTMAAFGVGGADGDGIAGGAVTAMAMAAMAFTPQDHTMADRTLSCRSDLLTGD